MIYAKVQMYTFSNALMHPKNPHIKKGKKTQLYFRADADQTTRSILSIDTAVRKTLLKPFTKHFKEKKCFFTLHNFSKCAESPFITAR